MTVPSGARRPALIATVCAAAMLASPAAGQTAPEPEATEQITVTATRRERALQSVPVAINALPASVLERAGVRDIQSLTQLVPSLQVPMSENSSSVTARIRGVGTQGSNPGLESAVGVIVDGVMRARNGVALTDLGELARIEVLRGPQGTLFGRNTSAGLISVITAQPQFEFAARGEVTTGAFTEGAASGSITGPLTDTLAGRLYVGARARDGWMDVNPGQPGARDGNDKDYWTARGQLLFAPHDAFSLRLIADVAQRDEECCYSATLRPSSDPDGAGPAIAAAAAINTLLGFTGQGTSPTIESQTGWADRRYPQEVEDWGVSAEAEWDAGGAELTAITAWRDWSFANGQDGDFSGADILAILPDGRHGFGFETFSQELRLTGTAGALDWLVGAYFSDETVTRGAALIAGAQQQAFLGLHRFGDVTALPTGLAALQAIMAGNPAGPWGAVVAPAPAAVSPVGSGQDDRYRQTAQSFALFTHNVVTLADWADLTLGLRWTTEEKDFSASYRTVGAPGCAFLEGELGLNPAANATAANFPGASPFPPLSNATLAALGTGLVCLPWHRRALDVLTATAPHTQSRSESEFSGVATLMVALAEEANLYGTYSRGYKAGGFNLDRAFSDFSGPGGTPLSIVSGPVGAQTVRGPDTSFAPEIVDSFEIGLKTTWLGGRLLANLTGFWQEFENYQLNTFTGVSFVVTSVPEVTARGVELDLQWTAGGGLTLTGGLAYAHTRYGENLGSLTTPGSFIANNPNLYFLPGAQLTSSPDWTVTGGATYAFGLGGGWGGTANADARWIDDTVTGSNLDPAKTQPAYALVNARLALTPPGEQVSLEFWGRNVFDERVQQIAFDAPLQGSAPTLGAPIPGPVFGGTPTVASSQINAFLGEPATYGVTLRVRW